MKRCLFMAVLVCLLALLFVACGDAVTTTDPSTTQTLSPSESAQTTTASKNTETTTASVTTDDTVNEAKRAELEALMKKDIARAEVIGNATIKSYGKQAGGAFGYVLSEKFNTKTNKAQGTSSVWHYTSYYAMISRLIDITEKSDAAYETFETLSSQVYNGFGNYSGTGNIITYLGTVNVTMYGVHRAALSGKANIEGDQSVYDDQMWIIRENIYRYQQSGDQKYLDEAIRLCKICINGWDYTLDENDEEYGGIPWGPIYATKHTCSNAPIIKPLVEIYEILKAKNDQNAQYYLDWAEKIYIFTRNNLKNPNNLYGDLVGTQRVERTGSNGKKYYVTLGTAGADGKEYTYNTGAMISGAVALYKATGRSSYLTQAKSSSSAAYRTFCMGKTTKAPYYPNDTQTIWFNLVLLQGFLDLYEVVPETAEQYIMSFQYWLDHAYDNYLKNGFLPRDTVNGWYNHEKESKEKFDELTNVMDQSSYAQMYAMLALWAEQRINEIDAKDSGN